MKAEHDETTKVERPERRRAVLANPQGGDRERLAQIFETLLSFARQDFEQCAPVCGSGDTIDAIAQGLNMLAEELRVEMASRRDLEAAYAELGEAQARAAHAGKLAAVGQLASGIAHEINNPATAVTMTLALSQRRLRAIRKNLEAGGEEQREIDSVLGHLDDASAALERIRTVTGDLRTFGRPDADLRELHSLNETVSVACRLAAPTLRTRADLQLELGEIPNIFASRARMAQVVTNLVVNAAQAIESLDDDPDTTHRITVTTETGDLGIVLSVEDTGPGIPDNLRDTIFEPFFTTKGADTGTGLGLALVNEIVLGEGGYVEVGRAESGGAKVLVHLPIRQKPRAEEPSAGKPDVASGLRVLLIDDEKLLLSALGAWLREEYGCNVTTCRGGTEAMQLFRDTTDFDLILCDIHMPKVSGVDIYQWIERESPTTLKRFAFLSGGALTPTARSFLDGCSAQLLPKPFREQELHDLLRAVSSNRAA